MKKVIAAIRTKKDESFFKYFREGLKFLSRNPIFYLIYLALYLFAELHQILNFFHLPTPWYISAFSLIAFYSCFVFGFSLPLYILKRDRREKIERSFITQTSKHYAKKLFWPFFLFFTILIVIGGIFGIIELIFHIPPDSESGFFPKTDSNHGFGFYPLSGLFNGVIMGGLFSIFYFAPFFYSLKKEDFFTSIKNGFNFILENFQFTGPLILFSIIFELIYQLFIPSGNYTFNVLRILSDAFITLVFTFAVFYCYKKHYSIAESVFELETIETPPSPVRSNVLYRRITAAAIDIIIWTVLYVIAVNIWGERNVTLDRHSEFVYSSLGSLALLNFTILLFIYYVILEWKMKGTVGKRLLGLKVLTENGSRISLLQSTMRNLCRIIDAFPYFIPYLLGLTVLANNDKRQRLGDKIAGTVVVK